MTRKFKPRLESLEDRLTPAVNTASLGLTAEPPACKIAAAAETFALPQQFQVVHTIAAMPAARSWDWVSGLTRNHNETLVRHRWSAPR